MCVYIYIYIYVYIYIYIYLFIYLFKQIRYTEVSSGKQCTPPRRLERLVYGIYVYIKESKRLGAFM